MLQLILIDRILQDRGSSVLWIRYEPSRLPSTAPTKEGPLQGLVCTDEPVQDLGRFSLAVLVDTSDGMNGQSRRTSAYLGQRPQQRVALDISVGYYGNRMSLAKPESTYVDTNAASINQPGVGRRFNNRANSDPLLLGTNNHGVYPMHGYHQSHDTVASASGNESHNTDPWVSTSWS